VVNAAVVCELAVSAVDAVATVSVMAFVVFVSAFGVDVSFLQAVRTTRMAKAAARLFMCTSMTRSVRKTEIPYPPRLRASR
jgi:hypothetical protein